MRTSSTLHDEHMHLRPHGVSPLPAHRLGPMLEAARAKGVVPGIREHAPLPARYRLGPDGDYLFCMRVDEVEPFLAELEGQGVPVGFEIDHLDGCEAETQGIVSDLLDRARRRGIPIGGLTGSVHFIRGVVDDLGGVDKGGIPHILCDYLESVMKAHLAEHGAERTVREYFASVRALIGTGFYDVVGHLELVRKWDRRDPETGVSELFGAVEDVYASELEATIVRAAEADVVLEYNTAGRDIVIGRPYLSDEAVRACVRHGVKLALSSDAHTPKAVGRYFAEATETLRGLGVRALYAVRDRERIEVAL